MNDERPTVASSLLEAISDYSTKVEKIVAHDPGNKVELACLYAGISGIRECVTALSKNGFISEAESTRLEAAMRRLYDLCSPPPG